MSKAKDSAVGSIILKYLNDQNRPYSTQDVFSNLQREHALGKTAVVKAMEQLAQQSKIKEKIYGKQKIYFADQGNSLQPKEYIEGLFPENCGHINKPGTNRKPEEQFPSASDSELRTLDSQITDLSGKFQIAQQSCRQLESELKDLNSSMTTEEMMKEIKELKEECRRNKEKLDKIKSATKHVTPEEKEKVYSERKQFCKEWKKRKRMAMDIFDAILEGYPKSKKQFFEEVGVETDEDLNITPPDI